MKTLVFLGWVGLLGLLLLTTGCQSSKKPGSSSHAAVEIKGHSPDEIRNTTVVVFAEQGYVLRTNSPGRMTFERPASSGEKFRYGDWMNDGMIMRIKVRLEEMTENDCLLRADVYAVQNPTEIYYHEENRITLMNRKPYQKMLDDVLHRLEGPPTN
jgi:hypothetical protein